MAEISFSLNGQKASLTIDPSTPLLWALRDHFHLVGTKYGCGIASCGACTVHIDGQPSRSCSVPIASINGKKVMTIEGLSEDGDHPLQAAWIEHDVPQCGYCQAGQIMQAAALLKKNPNPSDEEIEEAMYGNLCRCGTYIRIREAIKTAAKLL